MLWTWTFYPGRSMLPALPSRRNLEQILKDFFRRWGRGRLVSSICSFRFPRISGCYDSDTSVGLTGKTTLGFILSSLQSTAGALLHNGLLAISPSSTMDRKGSLKLMNSNQHCSFCCINLLSMTFFAVPLLPVQLLLLLLLLLLMFVLMLSQLLERM